MSVFWGMFAYSVIVLGTVTGLAVKVALLFKERGELRRKLDGQVHATAAAIRSAEANVKALAAARKEVKVLSEELDEMDADLDPATVVTRLERLLSGPVPDGGEGSDSGAVPATSGPDGD